jgi:hypothetical protein
MVFLRPNELFDRQRMNEKSEEATLEYKREFADRFREWRRCHFKTQRALADAAHIDINQTRKFENYKVLRLPSAPTLIVLAGLGLNIHWLLTG